MCVCVLPARKRTFMATVDKAQKWSRAATGVPTQDVWPSSKPHPKLRCLGFFDKSILEFKHRFVHVTQTHTFEQLCFDVIFSG